MYHDYDEHGVYRGGTWTDSSLAAMFFAGVMTGVGACVSVWALWEVLR